MKEALQRNLSSLQLSLLALNHCRLYRKHQPSGMGGKFIEMSLAILEDKHTLLMVASIKTDDQECQAVPYARCSRPLVLTKPDLNWRGLYYTNLMPVRSIYQSVRHFWHVTIQLRSTKTKGIIIYASQGLGERCQKLMIEKIVCSQFSTVLLLLALDMPSPFKLMANRQLQDKAEWIVT